MPIFLIVVAFGGLVATDLGGVSSFVEYTLLEFVMLGRIPATNLFLEFEAFMTIIILSVLALAMYAIFRSPVKFDS